MADILQVSYVYRVRATDMLYSAMVNTYIIVNCLLLLTVRCTSVQPKQIIYSCWKDRKESQYSSVEVALDGGELHNFTVVVVKYECENKISSRNLMLS